MRVTKPLRRVGGIPWKRKRREEKVCYLEGDSMHFMTTNDGRFYAKYEKFRPD